MSDKPTKNQRISLTKSQIQSAIGADLLELTQTITDDGSLSEKEVVELKSWLAINRSANLPSIDFLIRIVEHIIADSKVTTEERKELYKAIESILPSEIRKVAVVKRRLTEAEEKIRIRAERETQKQKEREKRELQRPLDSVNFMVAGVRHEGRPEIIRQYVQDGDRVYLMRDRQNKYSKNAIEIRLSNGMVIGYVPEEDYHGHLVASEIAPLLDQGCQHNAYITKMLTGGHTPIPVVQAYFYRGDAKIDGAVSESAVPRKSPQSSSSGCLTLAVFILVIFSLLFFLVRGYL